MSKMYFDHQVPDEKNAQTMIARTCDVAASFADASTSDPDWPLAVPSASSSPIMKACTNVVEVSKILWKHGEIQVLRPKVEILNFPPFFFSIAGALFFLLLRFDLRVIFTFVST